MWQKILNFIKGLFSKPSPEPTPAPQPPSPGPAPIHNESDIYGNKIIGGFGTGYWPDKPSPKDRLFSEYAKVMPLQYMPDEVDHSQFHGPVVSQGQTGSCTGQSARAACEYLAKVFWGEYEWRGSSLYAYWNARAEEVPPDTSADNGSYLRCVVQGIADRGICTMATWPFDATKVNVKPPVEAYKEGAQKEIRDYLRCITDDEIKSALAQNYPVVVGIPCYSTINSAKANSSGVVDLPGAGMPQTGGHAICLVGFNDATRRWKFKNSWGTDWGDKGYGYLPYGYVLQDAWCIRPKKEVDPSGNVGA